MDKYLSKIQQILPLGFLIFFLCNNILIHYLNNRGQKHAHVPKHDCSHVKSPEEFLLVLGHLHDGVILLQRPESFSFFLSYLNFVIPVRFK